VIELASQTVQLPAAAVPVVIRDSSGMTRELVLLITERGAAWPMSWIELPCSGTA